MTVGHISTAATAAVTDAQRKPTLKGASVKVHDPPHASFPRFHRCKLCAATQQPYNVGPCTFVDMIALATGKPVFAVSCGLCTTPVSKGN